MAEPEHQVTRVRREPGVARSSTPSPDRLRRARVIDRLMAWGITAGGSLILLSVALLVVFLVIQCLPLLRSGSATRQAAASGTGPILAALEDEYREAVWAVGRDARLRPLAMRSEAAALELPGVTAPLRQAIASGDGRLVAALDEQGTLAVISFRLRPSWQQGTRSLEPVVSHVLSSPAPDGARLLAVAGEEPRVLLATPDGAELVAEDGARRLAVGPGARVGALAADGSEAWLATGGQLNWYRTSSEEASLEPAAAAPLASPPTAATLLVGDTTLLLGDEAGTVSAWQAVAGEVAGVRRLDRAAEFRGGGAVLSLAPSERDKSFAILRAGSATIAHLTTRRTLVELREVPEHPVAIGLAPRRDGVFVTGGDGVARWALALPHPEVSAATLFLPVRYEGYTEPDLVWQTSGGSAASEPKISLIPLLVGTFKGALYALLFAAPAALLAALYVAQFAPPRVRAVSKPVVELMAALPSVVVGFLAALLIAPLLQRHLVVTVGILVILPTVIVTLGVAWMSAPIRWRRHLGAGRELALLALLVIASAGIAFALEDWLAGVLFNGDFEAWLLASTGMVYDQRNAIVVGFALGFAVIPIIFTLAEDAFANVPPSLISASLALGATPWQAARTVAIPAASPGLFAAVMLGLGRAVGETMIVLMATGNTPLLSLSPFNGMRTMSAAIAVELPEAPFGGSLFRVLILTALLLFVITFAINSLALLVSARLRRRFGRLAA